ncbi:MAG: AAA-like domain-containing protein [Blastocatellia bacterium]|nr:AAA-like domain-containing protein [Blastocatellia bacterium]
MKILKSHISMDTEWERVNQLFHEAMEQADEERADYIARASQVAELNKRYGSPLKDDDEVERFYWLVSGHPYLVRCGLQELVARHRDLTALEAIADRDDGPFGDHLRRIIASLEQDPTLREVARDILRGQSATTEESFYRLRSAGLFTGDSAQDVRPRCYLYATYMKKRLL